MSKISAITSFKQNNTKVAETQTKSNSAYYHDEERAKREELKESKILPDTFKTKFNIATHKVANTLSVYPTKGFAGDKNSNFYEFLTMGMFPYVTGGLTFIALFNGITKHFSPKYAEKAGKYGLGMALGVIFYGIAKEVSKKLISVPVKMKTGINMDEPYRKVIDLIPRNCEEATKEQERQEKLKAEGKEDNKAFEYHTTFESVDFPRMDLYYKTGKGENRNEYFDMIAEKNGFGTNLPDSDQEVKPFIKEVVTKARTAQTLSQYLWAAVGLGIGVQKPWGKLLNIKTPKYTGDSVFKYIGKNIKTFGACFKDSCVEFFNGGVKGAINPKAKVAGRAILGLAVLTTVLGTLNAVRNPYMNRQKSTDNNNVFTNNNKVQEG